jgi:hypothetical protein
MSDRGNDSGGQIYEASGLPRGLAINPSTGVCSGVACRVPSRHDLPRPDAVLSALSMIGSCRAQLPRTTCPAPTPSSAPASRCRLPTPKPRWTTTARRTAG